MTNLETPPASTLTWMHDGTERLTGLLATVDDAELDAPSLLPGWSRRHVLAHIEANARALGRLLHWARTGEETPMYPSREARDAEIEQDAGLSPRELRALVHDSAAELSSDLQTFPDERWASKIEARGRAIPASTIPWMRAVELWVHMADLDCGVTFADFPADLVDALLADVAETLTERGQDPALVLRPEDREREWLAGAGTASAVAVTGRASGLAAWVTGRGDSGARPVEEGTALPTLDAWR
ncbi:maleylpyruvate isomerase [Lipingzhangella halophila]|uniref:Maleylpyruvate isomerase n=1 Tax=Lipingzhangella halophila TaxID=1783352 RepID=A0A7W7W5C7_9ACTN|nr:maleylpyruvate isomerase family mycothiol-dependent enzyme [Lipingzhangella halophila]MBB4934573.1 maleylpyruvate isomerase [Lipingzhangella halophila]